MKNIFEKMLEKKITSVIENVMGVSDIIRDGKSLRDELVGSLTLYYKINDKQPMNPSDEDIQIVADAIHDICNKRVVNKIACIGFAEYGLTELIKKKQEII